MKISDLSAASGVPVPTIKYYLRERLLPPGRPTSATQAQYGGEHLARLRLIRALVDVGRLPLAAVRDVLAVVDLGDAATPAAVGAAHDALPPTPRRDGEPHRALAAMATLGWQVDPGSSALHQLELALATVESVGMAANDARLRAYGAAALEVASVDVAEVPRAAAAEAVQYVVIGTVLYEPVLLALRRLAQQHVFAGGGAGHAEGPRP